MKYRLLQELLTAELPAPAELPTMVDAVDMVAFAETMVEFCAGRMSLVPPPYRANSNLAVSSWNQCHLASIAAKEASTIADTRYWAESARQFALIVGEAANVDRKRVQRQIEWVDQERARQRREAGKES